ncbi:NAD-dependent epimerase/dehydratase family protein [candidate division WOR-3 bacterium]|uniref:NAD-dependent epimerase/dehydratase family protein n=1 Tax=candidate division WOR-3 bacterium TaxID=2052148 RepID=A0A937XI24_UNCW3|nr:NAD-dependent epimerase/dehydratase family protein [candidate division WOR-3 bacterium]
MRALVSGGAGFIGSNVVAALVGEGHAVTVLDDLSSGDRRNLDSFPQVRVIEGDVRNERDVAEAIKGSDVVFHLAASVGNKRSIDSPITDAEVNVLGSLRIMEAARGGKVRKVVVSSSAGIFGELKALPISENHPTEPDSPYGCTKLCEEKECLVYAKLYGIEVVCLRYFNVYGPNQRYDAYGNVIPIFVFQMLRGKPLTVFGDGEQTRDFVNVNDVVQANIKAAVKPGLTGAFNVASGTHITINRLVGLLCEVSGMHPEVRYGPSRPGDVLHSLADISAARAAFGYSPNVDMPAGLSEYVQWAKSEVGR